MYVVPAAVVAASYPPVRSESPARVIGLDVRPGCGAAPVDAAAGVACAGIRLPLPARPARPSQKVAIVMLVVWAAAVAALLRLSPMVRLTRATFYSFALMLGVFAIWGLAGFGYPSAPVPSR